MDGEETALDGIAMMYEGSDVPHEGTFDPAGLSAKMTAAIERLESAFGEYKEECVDQGAREKRERSALGNIRAMIDENKRAVAFLRSNLHMQQSKAVAFAQENRTLRDELAGERDTRARLEDELRVCRDRLTAAESAKATLGERLSSFEEEEIILRTACDAEMKARRTETRARAKLERDLADVRDGLEAAEEKNIALAAKLQTSIDETRTLREFRETTPRITEERDAAVARLAKAVKETRAMREACEFEVSRVREEAKRKVALAAKEAGDCARRCAIAESISQEASRAITGCAHTAAAIADRFHLLCRAQTEVLMRAKKGGSAVDNTVAAGSSGCGNRVGTGKLKKKNARSSVKLSTSSSSAKMRKSGGAGAELNRTRKLKMLESCEAIEGAVGASDQRDLYGDRGIVERATASIDSLARTLAEELMEMEYEYERHFDGPLV